MADGSNGINMNEVEARQEELADRLGITVEVAAQIAQQLRAYEHGDSREIFGRFKVIFRKEYEKLPGMKLGDFDNDVKNKHITMRANDGELLLTLFADGSI